MNHEYSNYLSKLSRSPSLLFQSIPFFVRKIYSFIERRVVSKGYYYPGEIRLTIQHCLVKNNPEWNTLPYRGNVYLDRALPAEKNKIRLSSSIFTFKGEIVPWEQKFNDCEELMSLHRWNWLLTRLSEEGLGYDFVIWGQKQIEDWMTRFITRQGGLIWDSYTVGERLCNGIIFYWITNQSPSRTVLEGFMKFVNHLITNLEYHGKINTGNHILNNGRALYFAGYFLGIKELNRVAYTIFNRELKLLLTGDNFLREGSSHYQFLFTRWILEILWLAKVTKDTNLSLQLEPIARDLVKRCWFFLVWNQKQRLWSIPLIGDISPDFSPEWLMDVPWLKTATSLFRPSQEMPLAPKRGFAVLIGRTEGSNANPIVNYGCQSFPSSGWYRVDHKDITIFLRVEPRGTPDYPTHGHSDIGSFCLYLYGCPVIVDPGRINYTMDSYSRYGVSALSHNTMMIDGNAPYPFLERNMLPRTYRCGDVTVKISELKTGFDIVLNLSGFRRLAKGGIEVTRTFYIRDKLIAIEDIFKGKGWRNLEQRYHFAPDIRIQNQDNVTTYNLVGEFGTATLMMQSKNNLKSRVLKGDKNDLGGWYFPKYGVKEITATLVYEGKIRLPETTTYRFDWHC